MKILTLPLILICISLGIVGQLSLKHGINQVGLITFNKFVPMVIKAFLNPYVLSGFILYGTSSILWLVVISRVPLSFAYPLVSISYIVIVFFSWFLFKENVTLIRWLGVFLISLGVSLIAQS